MATILIVDDDNLIRDTLHEFLSADHECHTADRAEQALSFLELESYDAVITDVAMPGLSGKEVLLHIQDRHPSTPVIIISGKPDGSDGKSLMEMGAFAYLTKPFRLDDIDATVRRAIARHNELKTG